MRLARNIGGLRAMTDAVIPGWIKAMKTELELAKESGARYEREQQLRSSVIKNDGPKFWKQLLKELAIAVEASKGLGVGAAMSDLSSNANEQRFQIICTARTNEIAEINYQVGDDKISVRDNGASPIFSLDINKAGTLVVKYSGNAYKEVSAEDAAQKILQPMLSRLLGLSFSAG
jgi:hypothetical protein